MAHRTTTLLTIFSFLFHVGVGCCAHHSHCSAAPDAADPVANTGNSQRPVMCACGHHASHEVDAPDSTDQSSESDSCPCGENHASCADHCSWLKVSKVELSADDGLVTPVPVVADGLTATLICPAGFRASGIPLLMSPTGDSLRATTQVWRL